MKEKTFESMPSAQSGAVQVAALIKSLRKNRDGLCGPCNAWAQLKPRRRYMTLIFRLIVYLGFDMA